MMPKCDWCPKPAVRFTRAGEYAWAWCEDCLNAAREGRVLSVAKEEISRDEWIVARVQSS